jgi:hypothetical protein
MDTKESARHVRAGYTQDDYRTLLEPIRFQIEYMFGISTPVVCQAARGLPDLRNELGAYLAFATGRAADRRVGDVQPSNSVCLSTKAINSGGAQRCVGF